MPFLPPNQQRQSTEGTLLTDDSTVNFVITNEFLFYFAMNVNVKQMIAF